MGKVTGFLEIDRADRRYAPASDRIRHYREFVLPLNIPSESGGSDDQYDDFTFDAVTWTLIAHEARPGHELQFDSMVEQGVSLARALSAFSHGSRSSPSTSYRRKPRTELAPIPMSTESSWSGPP